MNRAPKFWTHRGWVLFCPVYLADVDTDNPVVDVRHWIFAPLMALAEAMEASIIYFLSLTDPDYDPMFMFYLTGKLSEPIPVEGLCDDCGWACGGSCE